MQDTKANHKSKKQEKQASKQTDSKKPAVDKKPKLEIEEYVSFYDEAYLKAY